MTAVEYRAGGLKPVISISGDGGIEAALDRILVGWKLALVAPEVLQDSPLLAVEQIADGWLCSGEGFGETVTYRDPVAAGCAIISALFKAQTFADQRGLCLHAAGVRFGDGVVLMTGDYGAGKSVLTSASCAAGQQVFSDDILPLARDATAIRAPGLALRLRLPLPPRLDPATIRFLRRHASIESSRYLYVRPPEALLAQHGVEAPIRALVSIERREEGPACVSRMAPGDALGELIRRNFARDVPARLIVDTLDTLVMSVPCLRLVYSDAAEAVSLMQNIFAGTTGVPDRLSQAAGASRRPHTPAGPPLFIPDTVMISRNPAAGMFERGGEIFLTDPDDLAIFELNATGGAMWRLIENPVPVGEIVETFAIAFPDRARKALRNDLAGLMLDLVAKGLARLEEKNAAEALNHIG